MYNVYMLYTYSAYSICIYVLLVILNTFINSLITQNKSKYPDWLAEYEQNYVIDIVMFSTRCLIVNNV